MKLRRSHFFIAGLVCIVLFIAANYGAGTYLLSRANAVPSEERTGFEEVQFTTEDNEIIYGWYKKGEIDRAGILLLHGNGENRLSMLPRAQFLNKNGFSVLLIDFRAHGKSSGKYKSFGFYEARDALAAKKFLQIEKGCAKVGVLGFSLGAAAAVLGENPLCADAYILEALYPTIQKAISNRLKLKLGLNLKPFTDLLILQLKFRLGLNAEQLSPLKQLGKITSPVLIIAGTDDLRTTQEDSHTIFSELNSPKSLWLIKGAKHEDFFSVGGLEYRKRILSFFNETLK